VSFGGEPRSNGAQGQARRVKFAGARNRRLFALVDDKSRAVGVQREAQRHGPDALAACALGRERRTRARSNQPVLVLGRAVDHGADENVGRRIAVALTADAHDAAAFERDGGLDARCEHDVAGDPIAPCDDEHPCGVLAQGCQRRT